VALALKRKGITRVRPLLGGLDAWLEGPFPVERMDLPSQAKAAS
jgi:rhodanese-related sulfurtransferase